MFVWGFLLRSGCKKNEIQNVFLRFLADCADYADNADSIRGINLICEKSYNSFTRNSAV